MDNAAKRLLLLMTTRTYRATAFLDAASRLGVPVTVGSEEPQKLQSANPAGHLTIPFTDPAGALGVIGSFARRHPVGAVLAADDDGLELAAAAARALGLPHNSPASVMRARDKSATRQRFKKAGLRTPRYHRLSADDDPALHAAAVPYPCVVKPLSLSASRGVIRADNPVQFLEAFIRVRRILDTTDSSFAAPESSRWILVEEYLEGEEVALEGILDAGRLRVLALYDKPDPLTGPFFEESIYVTPSRKEPAVRRAIEEMTQRAVEALELRRGPVHVELRLDALGPWVVEVAARTIGGHCARTLRFDGASLEEIVVAHALGLPVASYERDPAAAGVMMIPIPRAGILRGVDGVQMALAVEGIEDLMITVPVGGRVVPLPEGGRYLGFIFARTRTPMAAEAALREAHARLDFHIEPVTPRSTPPG